MKDQLFRLNGLRADFMKWADSNEPSTWEIEVNKIGGNITGYTPDDDPIILLDCTDSDGSWFLCVEGTDINSGCYPIELLSENQIYEIRRLIETWLARKDADFFNIY